MSDIFQTTRHQIERHIKLSKDKANQLKDGLTLTECEIKPDPENPKNAIAVLKQTVSDEVFIKDVFYAGIIAGMHTVTDDIAKIEKLGL